MIDSRKLGLAALSLAVAVWTGCGASSDGGSGENVAAAHDDVTSTTVPHSSHVWIVTEENYRYENVIGNSALPYFNQLANTYGLATQYYSNQHSSLPALMWLVAGAPVETNNDTTSCQHANDNVVRELLKGGHSWRSYQDDMPYAGYQGLYGGTGNEYYRRHNPLIDFTDVCPGTGQDTKSVPFTQMATDLSRGFDPDYAYVTPDAVNDFHNGTPQQADTWLKNALAPLLARPEFQTGGDGLLFVTFDESDGTDDRCSSSVSTGCGGRVVTIVVGPKVVRGTKSTRLYHPQNVLATVCAAMGLGTCPGAGATAAPMTDFFASSTSTGVVISNPGNGSVVTSPVTVVASATASVPIAQLQVWDDGVKLGAYAGSSITKSYALATGAHTLTVLDVDGSGATIDKSTITFTVQAATTGVTLVSPTAGATVTDPVHVVASATESVSISQMQVWDDGVKLGAYAGASVNQYYTLAAGSHTLTVEDLDSSYAVIHKTTVTYDVASGSATCSAPTILEPTPNQSVGPAIDLRTSAPSCLVSTKCYLDGSSTAAASTGAGGITQWVSVSMGPHTLICKGTDAAGVVYASPTLPFTRTY